MAFQLVGKSGHAKGVHWTLAFPSTLVGRSNECDVVLSDESVSRRHCEFWYQGDELRLLNISDANLCLVNGVAAASCALSAGDEVAIGASTFFITQSPEGDAPFSQTVSEAKTMALSGLDSEYAQDLDAAAAGEQDLRTIHDLHDLYMLALLLGETTSYSQAVRILHEFTAKSFSGCKTAVYLNDRRRRGGAPDLRLAAGTVTESEEFQELVGKSLSECKSFLRKGVFENGAGSQATSVLVAPMVIRGETLGVLIAKGLNETVQLDERDLKFLTAMGRTVCPHLRALSENQELEEECSFLRREHAKGFDLVGESRAIGRVRKSIRQAARADMSVLILGETGTGKELAARLIHNLGGDDSGRYIVVNCPAIPRELFESHLFGHEAGAFTGAHEQQIGLVEQADGGTLFFDEVADLSLSHQARILRVLEDGVFRRVGGTTDIHVHFRTIAATNKDLARAVEQGAFREDLYHRLNAFEILLPPLSKRPSDVPLLAQAFLSQLAQVTGGRQLKLADDAVEILKTMPFRGNVRELKNRVHRAAAIAKDRDLTSSDFASSSPSVSQTESSPVLLNLREAEKMHITTILRACGNKVSEAAIQLGVSRSTLYKKIGDHGITT